ncbi:hemolysin family protein [Nocardioides pacificus]
MDQDTWLNILLVIGFVLLGGVFAGTEIALISLREGQIRHLEGQGPRGARVARVARDPNRFLATVQVGVTVMGFLSAAYGASRLAPDFEPTLEALGVPEGIAPTVALVGLTLAIAYLSLVLGELVPKRLALQRSAGMALLVGPPVDRLATVMRPVIWALSVSTDAVVRVLGGDPDAGSERMSQEELRQLVSSHEDLTADERRILGDVFEAGERSLVEVMRPRRDVTFLAADARVAEAIEVIRESPYSRYPVTGEDFDDVRGFLHVRDLLDASPEATVGDLARAIVRLPGTNRVLPSLSRLRAEEVHIAIVVDEYGGTDGIVTLEDLVEELVGDIRDEYDAPAPDTRVLRDGVAVVDATLTLEEFAEQTGLALPEGPYETASGFVVARLGRLAEPGDRVEVDGTTLVVESVERHHVSRIEVRFGDPHRSRVTLPGE